MWSRITVLSALLMLAGPAIHATLEPQTAQTAAKIPPISYVCPMHPDVVDDKAGICPHCKMNLVGVRLDTVWSCPVHSIVNERKAGQCPIDRRDLVQVTVAVSFTCPGRGDIDQVNQGRCPDGSQMIAKYTPRAHGNHNPQHGGQFFMAPDNWHHLEGTYPRAGVVRIYLYDDYTRPLAVTQARTVKGRIVTKETFDTATRTTKETAAFPLTLAPDGRYLEAKVNTRNVPAQLIAKVKLKDDGPEYRFDFTFPAFSKDFRPPAAAATTTMTMTEPSTAPAPLPAVVIPDTVDGMVSELKTRDAEIRQLIERGAFPEVYVPAFQAKDLALALDAHSGQLSPRQRDAATPAIKRLVQSAWLLDAFGDLGNRQQIDEAYSRFAAALGEIQSLFPTRR